jgi:hypothetical protein
LGRSCQEIKPEIGEELLLGERKGDFEVGRGCHEADNKLKRRAPRL